LDAFIRWLMPLFTASFIRRGASRGCSDAPNGQITKWSKRQVAKSKAKSRRPARPSSISI
jgi:hypothetical protein